jgi:hypothetical protein
MREVANGCNVQPVANDQAQAQVAHALSGWIHLRLVTHSQAGLRDRRL